MSDDNYTVRIDRRGGVVEISGPDKEWIAEQINALRVVFENPADGEISADGPLPTGAKQPKADRDGGLKATADAKAPAGEESSPRRKKGGGYRGKRNGELAEKLTSEIRGQLEKWVDERRSNWTEAPNQAAILAAFLQTKLSWEAVAADDLYTIYDVMGWPGPNPRSALDNAKSRKNYFTSAGRGKFQLSHSGERFGRHEAKEAATES